MDDNKSVITNKEKSISELYKELQEMVASVFEKSNYTSIRKSINQFAELRFIQPNFESYHNLTHRSLNASTDEKRGLIFS
ncbi:hypothetical protein [Carnobacterium funditum]|uniref:hypothetical protein n=1 Tax=Carnobacterium funditum TaxID=2752 RepID=UPI0005517342|nr:hypothetical protein [Carnobacterium funditum]